MVDALAGTSKTFVYTSGVWVLGETGPAAVGEDGVVRGAALIAWRAPLELWLRDAVRRGVRTIVIRPGVVYGQGRGIPGMMARGELPVVGDGHQHWAVVHVDDLAALYLAALERAPAGAVLHGVGDEVTARALGEALGAAFLPLEEATAKMGAFAEALALDQRVSSERTRELVGWQPRAPRILDAPDVSAVASQPS
jgi:nucleoside-diphosphate-sugar epimerase